MVQKFLSWYSKIHFTCLKKHFQDNCSFLKYWHFLATFAESGKSFSLLAKFFGHDCHNCILRVHWNAFIKKMLFWKQLCFFFIFRQGVIIFCPAGKIFQLDCGNCFWRFHCNTLMKTSFLNKNCWEFYHVRTLNESFSGSWRNTFGFCSDFVSRFAEPPSICPEEQVFLRECFFFSERNIYFLLFSDTDSKKFGPLPEVSGRVCQNCWLLVQRYTSGINILFEKLCSHLTFESSRTLSETVSTLCKVFLAF